MFSRGVAFALAPLAAVVLGAGFAAAGRDCSRALAATADKTQAECAALCAAEDAAAAAGAAAGGGGGAADSPFSQFCVLGDWSVNSDGRPVLAADSCLNMWVYGYEQGDNADGFVGAARPVAGLGACQQLCLDEPGCVRFMFDVFRALCVLKSEAQITAALRTRVFEDAIDSRFCNVEMPRVCATLYDCYECDGDTRCAYDSHSFIGAARYCAPAADDLGQCTPLGPWPWTTTSTTTTTSKPTTTTTTTATTTPPDEPSSTTTPAPPPPPSTSTAVPPPPSTSTAVPPPSTTAPTTAPPPPASTTTGAGPSGDSNFGAALISGVASAGAVGLVAVAGAVRYLMPTTPPLSPQDLEIEVDGDTNTRDLEVDASVDDSHYA